MHILEAHVVSFPRWLDMRFVFLGKRGCESIYLTLLNKKSCKRSSTEIIIDVHMIPENILQGQMI